MANNIQNFNIVQKIYIWIFALVPLIDSFNGYLIKSGISGNFSLGQLYRLLTLIFVIVIWSKRMTVAYFKIFIVIVEILFASRMLQIMFGINNDSFINEIMNIVQWIMIIILVFSYMDLKRSNVVNVDIIYKIFDIWRTIAPLTIIIPYILGLGFSTYYDTGYKAFYYATNAITYFLIILFLLNMMKLMEKVTAFRIVQMVMTAVAIAMIGTKSGYVFFVVILLVTVFLQFRKNFVKGFLSVIGTFTGVIAGAYLIVKVYSEELAKIYLRHSYFFQQSDSLLAFITTGRSDRIFNYYSYIKNSDHYLLRLIFGSGYSIETTLGSIEMDYFDAFFMFGIFGLSLVIWFTIYMFRKREKQKNGLVLMAYVITIVFSIFGGHVWDNALSSTCFAMVCCILISERKIR